MKDTVLFISDAHIGFDSIGKGWFVVGTEYLGPKKIYLVGDFWDLWKITEAVVVSLHSDLIGYINDKIASGVVVEKIKGNHDDNGRTFLNISEHPPTAEFKACNKKYLVIHGHQFDYIANKYSITFKYLNKIARMLEKISIGIWKVFKRPLTSLLHKTYYQDITAEIEIAVAAYAKSKGYDGVIMGHTHIPAHKVIDGVDIWNCGDLLVHSTVLVFQGDGFEIVDLKAF